MKVHGVEEKMCAVQSEGHVRERSREIERSFGITWVVDVTDVAYTNRIRVYNIS